MRNIRQWKYYVYGYSAEHGDYTDGSSFRYRSNKREVETLVKQWQAIGFTDIIVKTWNSKTRQYQ